MDNVDMAVSGTPEPASGSPQDGRADLTRGTLGFAVGVAAGATAVLAGLRMFRWRDRRKTALAARAARLERRVRDRTAELHAANRAVAESEARLRAIFRVVLAVSAAARFVGSAGDRELTNSPRTRHDASAQAAASPLTLLWNEGWRRDCDRLPTDL